MSELSSKATAATLSRWLNDLLTKSEFADLREQMTMDDRDNIEMASITLAKLVSK